MGVALCWSVRGKALRSSHIADHSSPPVLEAGEGVSMQREQIVAVGFHSKILRLKGIVMPSQEQNISELLREAKRNTHAARALARFILIFTAYQIFSIGLIALGASITAEDSGGVVFIFFGVLLAVAGLWHSLAAGFSELSKSEGS